MFATDVFDYPVPEKQHEIKNIKQIKLGVEYQFSFVKKVLQNLIHLKASQVHLWCALFRGPLF